MPELKVRVNDRKKVCESTVDGKPDEVVAMLLTMIHTVAEMAAFTDEEMLIMLLDIIQAEDD